MASDIRGHYPRGFVCPRIAVCAFPPIAGVEGAIRGDPFLAVLVHHVDVARLAPASVREGSASKRAGRTSTRSSQWHCAAADAVVYAGASSFVAATASWCPPLRPQASIRTFCRAKVVQRRVTSVVTRFVTISWPVYTRSRSCALSLRSPRWATSSGATSTYSWPATSTRCGPWVPLPQIPVPTLPNATGDTRTFSAVRSPGCPRAGPTSTRSCTCTDTSKTRSRPKGRCS